MSLLKNLFDPGRDEIWQQFGPILGAVQRSPERLASQYQMGLGLAAFGAVLNVLTISLYLRKKSRYRHWTATRGKLVGFKPQRGSGRYGVDRDMPVVVFHDSSGKEVRFTGWSKIPTDVVGHELPVRYNPSDSSQAVIERDTEQYFPDYVRIVMSFLVTFSGVLLAYVARHP